jgi:hypothetical protein
MLTALTDHFAVQHTGSPRSVCWFGDLAPPHSQHVRVGLSAFELRFELEHIIGVDDQLVFVMRPRKFQCLRSVAGEVALWALVQLSVQTSH